MSAHQRIERIKRELADGYPTVGLDFIARELGKKTYGPARLVAYVSLLIEEQGFPPPYPELVGRKGQQHLTAAVVAHSQFRRAAVEAWLEDFLPPANAAALDARAAAAAAADMDQAAGNLVLIADNAR